MDNIIKNASAPAPELPENRKLRVYYVIDRYTGPYAGTEKQLYLLIAEMVARGHDVRLFVFRHTPYTLQTPDFPCPIELCDVQQDAVSARVLPDVGSAPESIRRDRPDIVHAFFNDAAILIPLWCRTASTAVLTSRRDLGFWYSRGVMAGLRLANTRVTRIVCNSEAVARVVAEREHLDQANLSVILNALPAERLGTARRYRDHTSAAERRDRTGSR